MAAASPAARVNHEPAYFHPSEFPHNVPPLEHFLPEWVVVFVTGVLFLYGRGAGREEQGGREGGETGRFFLFQLNRRH